VNVMEITPSQAVQVKDIGIREPLIINDPWKLMDAFYSSEIYKKARERFLDNKILAADVSEKEKDRAFLESERAEDALCTFGTRNVAFKYQREKFPREVGHEIEEYIRFIRDSEKMEKRGLDQDQMAALDEERFKLHSDAAEAMLKAGIAPSRNIGRAIVGLLLIDKGSENPFPNKGSHSPITIETTAAKMRRKLGIAS